MPTDLQDLKNHIAAMPADELIDLAVFDAADYRTDVLSLAREELHKRGYSESDLESWRASAPHRRSNDAELRLARLRFALTLSVTAIVTFSLFAPLIYYSIVAYGIPCAMFIGAGYLIWLSLRKSDPRQARAFAIGFACGVSVLLLGYATAAPWYIDLITAECLCLWILIKFIRRARFWKRT
jgi:hypothetical protein